MREESRIVDDYGRRYSHGGTDLARAIERRVLGADYGGSGYTTIDQARRLGRRLGLAQGRVLLDLGAGCGWPGLYLARRTGCRVVSVDLPLEGLVRARRRAREEGTEGRCAAACSTARGLPFRDRAYDAVVHTDVLC